MTRGALLDTHIFIWALVAPGRLSDRAYALISDESQKLLVSVTSAWELAIKVGQGKLALPSPVDVFFAEGCQQLRAELLPIELAHLRRLTALPDHHRDPFDRMLVAQALSERLPLVSADREIARYDVQLVR